MVDMQSTENRLNSFEADVRAEALKELQEVVKDGSAVTPTPAKGPHNLHMHTFYSYNADGWSPSRLCWEAKKACLSMFGTVDFDVLDAMEETYKAGDTLAIPACVGMETRVYIPELAEHEISSPGEPGVAYFMGTGFARLPQSDAAKKTLSEMASGARARNLEMVGKINAFLKEVQIDYEKDAEPLTPKGNVTERHLLEAYESASRKAFAGDPEKEAEFWAGVFGVDKDKAAALLADSNSFRDTLRSKLMKKGGVGYAQPDKDTFPLVDDVIAMILDAEAIPTITWLDGTSGGEADADSYVELMVGKGCELINIIPDRNWNIKDPETKKIKVQKLAEMVEACRKRSVPVIVGTELNKKGLPFVDNFAAEELGSFVEDFHAGAAFMQGHTYMARAKGRGATSAWAKDAFADRAAKVEFYTKVGSAAGAPAEIVEKLSGIDGTPEEILSAIA